MPFPLPRDPEFRRNIVNSWLVDVEDRIEMGDLEGAEVSWKYASNIYVSLPPGQGDFFIEGELYRIRVKLDQAFQTKLCEP